MTASPVFKRPLIIFASALLLATLIVPAFGGASSHREAPLIADDPQADGTDFYMFRSPDAADTVTFVYNTWPIETPEGGPNFFKFGDDIAYRIVIDDNGDNIDDTWFELRFRSEYRTKNTFLYNTGAVTSLDDPDLNFRQFYSVTRMRSNGSSTLLVDNAPVPPVNIGPKSTPNYEALAASAVRNLAGGGKVFAGQRDDPFFVDLGATFDLLTIRPGAPGNKGGGIDSLAGYNVQSIVLQVPIASVTNNGIAPAFANSEFGVIAGRALSLRQSTRVYNTNGTQSASGPWVQVSRLGMPLVNEVVIPLALKDAFNALHPRDDGAALPVVLDPEAARLLKALYGLDVPPAPRNDLVAIFLTGIAGLNKPPFVLPSEKMRLNLFTPATAIGAGNRMGLLGGESGGYPNGRRLIDDVVDITLQAAAGGTPFTPAQNKAPNNQLGDGVNANEKPFLAVFPYVASPHQGFDHTHHRTEPATP